jgi:hypothetical protein
MLFPILGPAYYDEKDRSIRERMEAFYAQTITINQSFWGEADTDMRFYTGDQTLWNDLYGNLPANRRRQFTFNRIMRVVHMIEGRQRQNRKSTICVPVLNGNDETADQFTKVLTWINNQEGVLETISEAFHGALITGMNFLSVSLDFRDDPVSGNFRIGRENYNSWLVDPYFRKHSMEDCNGMWKRSFLTKRECVSLMPNKAEEIAQLEGLDSRDGKFQFMPESYNYGLKNLLTYDEFYYRDYRRQKLLVDSQTGETLEWKSQDKEALKIFLRAYPTITVMDTEIPTVKLAILVQGKTLYDSVNPLGIDQYPFVPVMAYYNPDSPYFPWRIQGVVRGLRDAQFLYGRRKVIELDMLESQINTGWKYKENALVNPADVFMSGQGKGLALKHDALMTDVEQIIPTMIPPTTLQLSEMLGREINELAGTNEELLGSAVDDKAGILSMLRQGAGLTTLQILYDQLDISQKLLGKIMIDVIQNNFTPGKIERIIGGKASPQFYNKAFGRYGAVVEEGLNTSTQKQMQFAQLMQLREMQVAIPDSILIEAATIQNKKELVDALQKQQEQQQQQQQQAQQLEMQALQSKIKLDEARAIADQGLGVERMSRVQENQALAQERRAAAEKDEEIGLLNLVKALKEIEGLDISHIEQLVRIAHILPQATTHKSANQTNP